MHASEEELNQDLLNKRLFDYPLKKNVQLLFDLGFQISQNIKGIAYARIFL